MLFWRVCGAVRVGELTALSPLSLPADPYSWIKGMDNKKLSYRRETSRQLPTWRGLGPPAHSPAPSGYTYAFGRIRNPQQTYGTSSVSSTKCTLR